jgi:hypothetical protein
VCRLANQLGGVLVDGIYFQFEARRIRSLLELGSYLEVRRVPPPFVDVRFCATNRAPQETLEMTYSE